MTEPGRPAAFYRPGPLLRRLLGPLAWRPRLTTGVAAGFVVFGLLALMPLGMNWMSRAIVSWDVACAWFLTLMLWQMDRQSVATIKARVAEQDEGEGIILLLVLVAAAVSLLAVGFDLSLAKTDQGAARALHVGTAVATVAFSWLTVQTIFALHYAHEYYAPDDRTPEEGDVVGGLAFPGDEPPDYWDFFHFAVVIGVASQTADIAFTSKALRRIGTIHGLVAFVFNAVVLALTINLVAGLF